MKNGTNRRILVIDDDEGVRKSYQGILVQEKEPEMFSMGRELFSIDSDQPKASSETTYELSMANNGIDGIEKVKAAMAENRPFAVAFIDMKMPGINGAETSARIWEIDPDIKIVIVTAYSEYSPEDIILVTGRKDIFYLRKPFNSEEIIQFARTLTTFRDLEDREKRHLELLEQTVAERTSELREANRKLKKIDKEKSVFIQYLAHEINTPLNWIAITQLINKDELSKKNAELLDFVEKGFERLSEFIKEMISYFELSSPDAKFHKKQVSLRKVITEILDAQQEEIYGKKLEIRTAIHDEATIFADYELLHMLVHVLVDNAVKYSKPQGSVLIEVHKEQDSIILEVKDWGCGIPQERIGEIFDSYANIATCRHSHTGFGLNLPKAKVIADINSWDIKVRSDKPDGETCFSVRMDRTISDDKTDRWTT